MKVLSIGFLFSIVILYSCRKDDTSSLIVVPVYAGKYDSSYSYHELSSPLHFSLDWDSLNLYGRATDSLDLNMDGVFDFIISLTLVNYDSLELINGFPNPFANFAIQNRNQFNILTYTEFVYTGLGSGHNLVYVKDLVYGERIDTCVGFSHSNSSFDMWRDIPKYAAAYPIFGNFYYANSIRYIAFVFAENKYGWIKVDMTDRYDPVLLSCAVQM